MGKKKLQRFEEMREFKRVFQPQLKDIVTTDHFLKNKWKQEVFFNENPLILELGCGKGEYTVGLAKRFPGKNFIGVDIKGARIWKGAKIINEEDITNAAFIRTRIEVISSFFGPDEVDEIWLTFPDPQLKKRRWKKRLCSSIFLSMYRKFLKPYGIVHLKTDSEPLYDYALRIATENRFQITDNITDLYHSGIQNEILGIQTFYEKQFVAEEKAIFYLKFLLPPEGEIKEPGEGVYLGET